MGAVGGNAGAEVIPLLVDALTSSDDELCYSACYALGNMGSAAKRALPALRKLTTSDDDFMRLASVWAMVRIDPTSQEMVAIAVPLLTKSLGALGRFGARPV